MFLWCLVDVGRCCCDFDFLPIRSSEEQAVVLYLLKFVLLMYPPFFLRATRATEYDAKEANLETVFSRGIRYSRQDYIDPGKVDRASSSQRSWRSESPLEDRYSPIVIIGVSSKGSLQKSDDGENNRP
jgi:hypothetical protein